jgi:NADH-quinone oxidoreductase subunit L
MTVPLIILAILSIVGGLAGIPHALGGSNWIEGWLAPVFERAESRIIAGHESSASAEYLLMALSVGVALAGIFLARRFYLSHPDIPGKMKSGLKGAYALLWNKYYVDEVYDAVVVNPIKKGSDVLLWKWIDIGIIDGIVNGSAKIIAIVSGQMRKVQVGVVQAYAVAIVAGIILVLGMLILK